MIFSEEFIWRNDHYAYHLTESKNIKLIQEKGLVPMIGKRSISVNDNIKAIYFFDNIYSTEDWINELYKDKDPSNLELLRFNLKNRKWYIKDLETGEFYLTRIILPSKIEYLRLYDEENEKNFNLNNFSIKYIQEWNPINSYKK